MDTKYINEKIKEFEKYFGKEGEVQVFLSPGRVNIIGEHLDYNGGYVFPAAISLGIYGFIRFRDDRMVTMRSSSFTEEVSFNLDEISFNEDVMWANYPAGVMKSLLDQGRELRGCDIFFDSTLPDGSGLSSSAAIEVLTAFMMIGDEIRDEADRVKLAEFCRAVENNFIGVKCGIMDQFAVAMGKEDSSILLNSDTLDYKYVPLKLGNYRLVIMNSNKPRKLADSKYNERLAQCGKALEYIKKKRNITALADAKMADLELIPDEIIRKRARHVISENNRVLASIDLLSKNNLEEFGEAMIESHRSLQYDYEVSGTELDALVDASLDVEGCIGARMTGAGFGGCAIALVHSDYLDKFKESVGIEYKEATGLQVDFYENRITDGVRKLK